MKAALHCSERGVVHSVFLLLVSDAADLCSNQSEHFCSGSPPSFLATAEPLGHWRKSIYEASAV